MKKIFLSLMLVPLMLGGCNWFNKNKNNEPEEEEVTEEEQYISVAETELSLEIGEQYQLQITQIKKTIILCQSNNDEVATVSRDGLVTAIAPGETTISVTGGKDRYVIFVNVLPPEAKDSLQIVMVKTSFTIALGDDYVLPFIVKLGNEVVESATLTYTYETSGIVSIAGLNVTTQSAGTTKCVVTASYNEYSASSSFTITVY